ncbi:beta-glucan synthesis-associated, partial [Mycena maculata]
RFHLAPDPVAWGSDISHAEADDALHGPRRDVCSHNIFTVRGVQNVGCMAFLALCIVGLLCVSQVTHYSPLSLGYPIDLLHVNASGQASRRAEGIVFSRVFSLREMYTINGYHDPTQSMQLVFSDKFEMDGRTCVPGTDPYWEAIDLHYWQPDHLEWYVPVVFSAVSLILRYDPSLITTRGGALEINLTSRTRAQTTNSRTWGGMMSSWSKFCFTGGLIVTSVQLPGINNVFGLYPAVWTMGNLGRVSYGLDGMWPYVYDSCDVGTVANQTLNGGPPAALTSGASGSRTSVSCLAVHGDSTCVGHSAPEIDIFEAQIGGSEG